LRLLLDTHVWIWFLRGERRLGKRARKAIENARYEAGLLISAITPWEIAVLVQRRKLSLSNDTERWIAAALAQPGYELQPLTVPIAVEAVNLGLPTSDPADRIIVATARRLQIALVTADAAMLAYGEAGHVNAIDATA